MPQYPGHDTDFFIVLNGVVTGPLTGLSELVSYNVTADTPVWYDGLDDWKPAIMAPLTRQLFTPGSEFHKAMAEAGMEQPPLRETPPVMPTPQPVAQPDYVSPLREPVAPQPPKSYLGWAIAVTVFCNLLTGIIAIIYSCKVKSKYAQGNYESAEKCSATTQWWIAGSICLGLVAIVAKLFMGDFF